uniref:DNA/RNA-binding protein Alba-like domain-containing protein n=1 Tax=Lygus hesperus TaxID=30085 RepID=A0A0A9ZI24_LYGHE
MSQPSLYTDAHLKCVCASAYIGSDKQQHRTTVYRRILRRMHTCGENTIIVSGTTPYRNTIEYIRRRVELLQSTLCNHPQTGGKPLVTLYAFNTSIGVGVTVVEIVKRMFPTCSYAMSVARKRSQSHSRSACTYVLCARIEVHAPSCAPLAD